jgi:hypothetical protein
MNILTIANVIANAVVVFAVAGMAIRVFGNPNHEIHSHPRLLYIRKFISSLVICGAVLNIITLSTPSWTEIVLNYGFAVNYLYSLHYHDSTSSSSNTKVPGKILKQHSSSGTRRVGVAKKNPSASGNGRKRIAS